MRHETDPQELPPSKSQLKRDAHALQKLGVHLLEIPESEWIQLGLNDDLVSALREAKRLHSHGARKRQLKYIGRLMRDIDPEPVQRYFSELQLKARQQTLRHRQLEAWRDRLIAEGDRAVDAFLEQHGEADRQHLRQLIRQAKKEQTENKPPKASRAIFRYLRDLDQPGVVDGKENPQSDRYR